MSDKFELSIADSLEIDPRLLKYLPSLLQDLWALGSSVDIIVQAIRSLQLPGNDFYALDLGCGKGAVSVRLAQEFGIRMLGIDAMIPFLDVAREKAREHQVENLCQFQLADLHEFLEQDREFDLVILASMGGILGDYRQTVSKLRRQVRKRGYIIIDDGYLRKGKKLNRKGYEHYRNHKQTIADLTSRGDYLIQESSTEDLSHQINQQYFKVISERGSQLSASHPHLKNLIRTYIDLQAEENRIIEDHIVGTLWLLQKEETT